MPDKAYHTPVMLPEILESLNLHKNSIIIDATCGEGGHSEVIIQKIPEGKLICIDRNALILSRARSRLNEYQNISYHNTTFDKISIILAQEKILKVDGIFADLGISLFHLQGDKSLGFSYTDENSLDMRLDESAEVSAADIVNRFNEKQIADILYIYGEEYESRKIAGAICRNRPVKNAFELSQIILRAKRERKGSKIHPAAKSFQALRIFVNKELKILESFIPQAVDNLQENGRLAIISYHSLEDRIVKNAFKDLEKAGLGRIMTKKPMIPSQDEMRKNRAARSAKLRIFEKRGLPNE